MSEHLDDLELSRLIDGDLSLTRRTAALHHLEGCSDCARRHDELVGVAARLRLADPPAWSAHLTQGVVEALPARDGRRGAAGAAVASLALVAAAAFVLAPALAAFGALGAAIVDVNPLSGPAGVAASGPRLLLVLVATALLAPLLALPLARWR